MSDLNSLLKRVCFGRDPVTYLHCISLHFTPYSHSLFSPFVPSSIQKLVTQSSSSLQLQPSAHHLTSLGTFISTQDHNERLLHLAARRPFCLLISNNWVCQISSPPASHTSDDAIQIQAHQASCQNSPESKAPLFLDHRLSTVVLSFAHLHHSLPRSARCKHAPSLKTTSATHTKTVYAFGFPFASFHHTKHVLVVSLELSNRNLLA